MAKNWALVIGINGYNPLNFSSLKYAKSDAECVKAFFEEAGFEEICYFADDSPPLMLPTGQTIPTQPTYGNLISFLQDRFEHPFLTTGDNCWFFFAGHGERHQDRDYLMPMDANSRGEEVIAGLPVSYVRERLSRCGADNVILLLDACRSEGSRGGMGIGQEVQQGVITLSSCSPTQKSWEIEELGQGAFTYALLEALRLPGERSCATVERLGHYLKYRVPELCRQYGKVPEQLPRISVDPAEKQHFILMPQHALAADITALKKDAYQAEALRNLELARQLWIRVLAAAAAADMEAIAALERIKQTQDLTRQESSHQAKSSQQDNACLYPLLISQTRQQFLRWLGLGGVGILLAALGKRWVRYLRQPPSPSSDAQGRSESSSTDRSTLPNEVDYSTLESLLKRQQWKQANTETQLLTMQSAGWAENRQGATWNGLISGDDFQSLPCDAIARLDHLWRTHSQNRFGFSVQQKIYLEGSTTREFVHNETDWSNFGDRVGWRKQNQWLRYSELQFDLAAPVGHLPCFVGKDIWGLTEDKVDLRFVLEHFLLWLFERMTSCNPQN
ncbi:MAG TPA: GUN4 domain-containing protein [Leptolyngbyaceae cyanobacterium]